LCCALLCGTAGCVRCHCCLFIGSCRWYLALLCDTPGCVRYHCCQSVAFCRWNTRCVRLNKPAFCSTVQSDQRSVSQSFLPADLYFTEN
jgi:hypothetical protein